MEYDLLVSILDSLKDAVSDVGLVLISLLLTLEQEIHHQFDWQALE